MEDEKREFLEEGMKRYKQAAMVMVAFGKEVESILQSVLQKHDDWGNFKPVSGARAKSTTYWSNYPLLNAKIEGKYKNERIILSLAVNWYKSKGDYPYYSIGIENTDKFLDLESDFDWSKDFEFVDKDLRYYPDPKSFDIEGDLKKILEEFSRFLKEV